MATLLQPPAPVNRAAVEGTRPADDGHDLPALPEGDPSDLPPAMPVVVLEEDTDLEELDDDPFAVGGSVGVCDAHILNFLRAAWPALPPDLRSEALWLGRVAADLDERNRVEAVEPRPAQVSPPAIEPFPEPPAGLPYYPAEPMLFSIYRSAWPHLDADQRAEVRRLIDIDTGEAIERRAEAAERAAAAAAITREQRERATFENALLPRVFVALDTFADLAADADGWLRAFVAGPDHDGGDWLEDIAAAGFVAGIMAWEISDMALSEKALAAVARPRLPGEHAGRDPEERMAELLAVLEVCLRPADEYVREFAGDPDRDTARTAARVGRTAHAMRTIVMCNQNEITPSLFEDAVARVRVANP